MEKKIIHPETQEKKQAYSTRLRADQIQFLKSLNNAAKWLERVIDGATIDLNVVRFQCAKCSHTSSKFKKIKGKNNVIYFVCPGCGVDASKYMELIQ
jgi:rubredoxin